MMEQIKISTIESGLSHYKDQLDKIISKEKLVKEIGFAVQAVNSNKKLQECSQTSIIKAVYNVALTGLSLNPIQKFAALVPKYISGSGMEAVLFPQYQGLVKLLTDTGSVISCTTNLVFKGDEFEYSLGLHQDIKHKPKHLSKEVEFAYAIGKIADGSFIIEVMDKESLDFIRSLSDTWKAYEAGKISKELCIWFQHEGEMYRKTVLKRLCKYLPKTEQWNKVHEAINIDNEQFTISEGQEDFLFSLISKSSFDDDTKEILERKVSSGLNPNEFEVMKLELEQNQLNPVLSGNYNQTDLKKHISTIAGDNRKNQNHNLFNNQTPQP